MNMYDLIIKKKRGHMLSADEIDWMIREFTNGTIPDYQMSAMLMAICFVGMTDEETKDLTLSMAQSGDVLDLSAIHGIKVDKHSTGGVGDKTSLILAPLVASLGIPVAKMSGRGLGHTGGTIDKLESFHGFSTILSTEEFIHNVNTIHIAIAGQTANLAPADKKLYALRDVTGTVDQMSLIASSIMSKKLAAGADGIVLDVKTGDGAFMKSPEDAKALAKEMVSIGKFAGRNVTAVISDMDQPLGYAVGNVLEVKEAIETLHGRGPADLEELCLILGSIMVVKAGKAADREEAKTRLKKALHDESAFQVFCRFIEAQGGSSLEAKNPDLLQKASYIEFVYAETDGYIGNIDTEEIGKISLLLGGGRLTKDSMIDLSVGIILCRKKGDKIKAGEPLAQLHANQKEKLNEAALRIKKAFHIQEEIPAKNILIWDIIE